MSQDTIRKVIYRAISPCHREEPYPDCKEKSNAKCPKTVCPHAAAKATSRTPSQKMSSVEIVSDRMNVSQKVLNLHYDKRREAVKLEQRCGYLYNI